MQELCWMYAQCLDIACVQTNDILLYHITCTKVEHRVGKLMFVCIIPNSFCLHIVYYIFGVAVAIEALKDAILSQARTRKCNDY